MERRVNFYGTPLNKSLDDEAPKGDVGPITNRRHKRNQQQTVRDDQGRRRFHGAFTGGFSAGYYNTVDSVEGFKPKQFVSRRGQNDGGLGTSFTHRPEDYMDDEDLGEFGIAPKKIRVIGQYTDTCGITGQTSGAGALKNILQPAPLTIGERILDRMSQIPGKRSLYFKRIQQTSHETIPKKDDFHGLGYKPLVPVPGAASFLKSSSSLQSRGNPLTAVLGEGRRLKISGEAFGSGVLDDDDELVDNINDEYGYDDIKNYDFATKEKFVARQQRRSAGTLNNATGVSTERDNDDLGTDRDLIFGFELARDLNEMNICDSIEQDYPLPEIPRDWKLPVRSEPYVPPIGASPEVIATFSAATSVRLHLQGRGSRSDTIQTKFTSGKVDSIKADDMISGQVGLVRYSDLKTVETNAQVDVGEYPVEDTKPTISRSTFEWRPCSLLCKRFNVPNPFPDSTFCGVKPGDLVEPTATGSDGIAETTMENNQFASMELKKSIFNVAFPADDDRQQLPINTEVLLAGYDDLQASIDQEDEPQVLEVIEGAHDIGVALQEISDDEPDIVVVTPPRRSEPEVIEISSSSSSSDQSCNELADRQQVTATNSSLDDDTDTYGPPLPPNVTGSSSTVFGSTSADPASGGAIRSTRSHHKSNKHKKRKRHKQHR